MGAKFTLDAASEGAVRAIQLVNKQLDQAEKNSQKAATAAKRFEDSLERQAQKIKEQISPQEKLNRQYRELGVLVQHGKLSIDQATAAGVKYRQEMLSAANAGRQAFGEQAAQRVVQMAASYLSVSAVIGTIISQLREEAQLREQAAQKALQSRAGLGSLSQLAATSRDPRAAFGRLVAEARGFVSSGAAADENEAGNLLFELAGAGLNRGDRAFAAQLRSAGTLSNVGGAAQAFDALRTALGAKETGSFRQFVSKALQAAAVAPGSFENLPIAAAQAGGSAKQLGVSDEFLLAATAIAAKTTGSPEEGGTQIAAFLKQAEKAGKFGGLGGVGIVEKIASLPAKQQGFGGVLGDRAEAVAGFRVLRDNIAQLRGLEAEIAASQGTDLAGRAARLTETDPQLFAARVRAQAEGGLDVARGEAVSQRENLVKALRAERRAAARARGESEFGAGLVAGFEDIVAPTREISRSVAEINRAYARGEQSPFSDATTRLLEEYLGAIKDATEGTQQQQRARNVTRRE